MSLSQMVHREDVDKRSPLLDTVSLTNRSRKVAQNRDDKLQSAAYNKSDRRLGGQTIVKTLSIWLERINARVGLLKRTRS